MPSGMELQAEPPAASEQSRLIAGFASLSENSYGGDLHLPNSIVFAGSALKRSRG
jgi:hypothetical protein